MGEERISQDIACAIHRDIGNPKTSSQIDL